MYCLGVAMATKMYKELGKAGAGNTLSITIPSAIARMYGLEHKDCIGIVVDGSKWTIDFEDVRKPTATKEV